MDVIPTYVNLIFIGVCVAVFGFIFYAAYWSVKGNRTPLLLITNVLLGWLLITGWLTFKGFFQDFESLPPRLFLFVGPTFLLIFGLLIYPKSP
jgi:hypothetical protein